MGCLSFPLRAQARRVFCQGRKALRAAGPQDLSQAAGYPKV